MQRYANYPRFPTVCKFPTFSYKLAYFDSLLQILHFYPPEVILKKLNDPLFMFKDTINCVFSLSSIYFSSLYTYLSTLMTSCCEAFAVFHLNSPYHKLQHEYEIRKANRN